MGYADQPTGPTPTNKDKKEKTGLGHVFARVKSVLKKGDAAPRGRKSPTASSSTAMAPPVTNASGSTAAIGSDVRVTIKLPAASAHDKAAEARARYEAMHGVTKLSRSQMFEERARKLSERFGLEIDALPHWQISISRAAAGSSSSSSSSANDTILRMDKPIRMRIRRNCHRCNAAFVPSSSPSSPSARECANCHHVRCTKCTRYPPKRSEAEAVASRAKRAAMAEAHRQNAPIIAEFNWGGRRTSDAVAVIKRPSKTGGQDLVHKKPRQRVRRTCHSCNVHFAPGSKVCDACKHVRCTDCPRDPPKKEKYPLGYPGDAFGPNSIPRYECSRCRTLYPADADDGAECKKCKTPKSDQSPRALPRKMEPLPDPDVVEQIQAKLQGLKVQ